MEKDASETSSTAQSRAPSSDRPTFWTICPFCAVRYKSYRSLLNKPSRCQSCYSKFLANKAPVTGGKASQTTLPTMGKSALSQNHVIRSNLASSTPKNQLQKGQPQTVPFRSGPIVMNRNGQQNRKQCAQVGASMGISRNIGADKHYGVCDTSSGVAVQLKTSECARSDLLVSRPKNQQEKAQAFSLQQQKNDPSKNPGKPFFGNESSSGLSCAVKVGEKRKRNEYGENYNTENHSKYEDVIGSAVHNNKTGFIDNGDAGRREESGWGKQLHGVHLCKETLPNAMSKNGQLNMKQDAQVGAAMGISQNIMAAKDSGFCDTSSELVIQSKTSECVGLKFNDFDKLREEVKFGVGQAWALYDTDGMPRLYALIRKVSAPCFGLRITYLEPEPDHEKEKLWFEEDLPISVGNFRLGKNVNTKDRSIFSHKIICREGSNGHIAVIPRKGETWALFKNWDINWSSEPDSHRKSEYEFVEILSDYANGGGVSVVVLHKAKGFARVFFRMGTGDADILQIRRHSLYRFSHRVPSFKLTGIAGKGVPKDAYVLDQAALPETIKEIVVPPHLFAEPTASKSESNRKSKPQTIYFASKGKVFQIGQIWSFCGVDNYLPLYYGMIKKITFTQALEKEAVCDLHVSELKATPFPMDVIEWEDKKMPVGCGTFYAKKALRKITPDDVSQQIVPQTSMDGTEYTILPKTGEVWVIYRYWYQGFEFKNIGRSYDIVEVLDDTLDYKVLLLGHERSCDKVEDVLDFPENLHFRAGKRYNKYTYNLIDGSKPIFTIPKSERLRFSHKVLASRVTKEIYGELKDLIKVVSAALPYNLKSSSDFD